jgi:hypothetical protein
MAKDVYHIRTAEGFELDYHRDVESLKRDYPGAVITGRRVMNDVGEGTYEPYSIAKAQAERRKAEADKTAKKASSKKQDEAPAEAPAEEPVEVVVAAPAEAPAETGN